MSRWARFHLDVTNGMLSNCNLVLLLFFLLGNIHLWILLLSSSDKYLEIQEAF